MRSDFFGALRALSLIAILSYASVMCAAECVYLDGDSTLPPKPTAVSVESEPEETIPPHPAIEDTESTAVQTAQHPQTQDPIQIPITIKTIYIKPYSITDEERAVVEAVVASESGAEDYIGQCLVAQCIRNTAEATGMRPDDVVLEEGQYAEPNEELRYLVEKAVSAVFDDGLGATDEEIRYFYAPLYCISKWHEEKLQFVLEHGGHRFFKEKQS